MRDPRKDVSVVMFLKCCICIAPVVSVNINPYAGRVALDICMYGMCVCVYVELWTIGGELSSSESTPDLVMFTVSLEESALAAGRDFSFVFNCRAKPAALVVGSLGRGEPSQWSRSHRCSTISRIECVQVSSQGTPIVLYVDSLNDKQLLTALLPLSTYIGLPSQ